MPDFPLYAESSKLIALSAAFAYLISPRFQTLAAENALVMDELNPEVRQYLDAARRIIKSHFLAHEQEKSAFAREWEERIAAMSREERKELMALIKKSLKS